MKLERKRLNNMKRVYTTTIIILLSALTAHSTTILLDSIKNSMASFINIVERSHIWTSNDFPDFMIYDRGAKESIKEGKEGVFVFYTLSSGARTHFLLVEKDRFQILNMTDSIDINVLKLIQFFKRNKQYCVDSILFYINDLITTYQQNEAYIKSFNGIIK
jgi:hypothetical protein